MCAIKMPKTAESIIIFSAGHRVRGNRKRSNENHEVRSGARKGTSTARIRSKASVPKATQV